MYGLKMQNGDFILDGEGSVVKVTGADRIKQELSAWLMTPLGSNPFYPGFGSRIHEFVGTPLTTDLMFEVKAEVSRVIQNYVAYQARQIQESQTRSGDRNFVYVWKSADIIASVDDIKVSSSRDSIKIAISLVTAGGRKVSVVENVQ